ncbi:phosphotransferase enzyme family protein [Chondrinema litorale]|uniref:phosphotransferase enzyme family protein n=1 Tax=Chondrinema litorale TaxID=2994555 RepID=UPI002543F204|nr:aminoglycoside phosphotransferase family protein [Chondrinema litorale]UZR98337.1 aminoglycoside phosphotransferase family protein [Chondrinema litorale]
MSEQAITNIIHLFFPTNHFTYQLFGSGHIHDTFLVELDGNKDDRYILQKVNHHVFKDVEGMMQNIDLVTKTLKNKLDQVQDNQFKTTEIISTSENKLYAKDEMGSYWRMYSFLSNSTSYDKVTDKIQAFEAGYAFGKFQKLLSDLPADKLVATIPDFHNMKFRINNFNKAIDADKVDRVKDVSKEIAFVKQRASEMIWMYELIEKGDIPLKVTHNDTKFNNVLLDKETQKGLSVIDLDTVMPGSVLFDFGDAVRTIVNTKDEDEEDTSTISVSLAFFEAFAEGFLKEVRANMNQAELDNLVLCGRYMTFIMGLRFLTDFVEGDVYYKIKNPLHNKQRAKAQFALIERMEEYEEEMQTIIDKLSK